MPAGTVSVTIGFDAAFLCDIDLHLVAAVVPSR